MAAPPRRTGRRACATSAASCSGALERLLPAIFLALLCALVGVLVILLSSPAEARLPQGALLLLACGVPLVFALLAAGFGGWAFRRFGSPVIDVMAAADAVAEGDLSVRVSENIPGEFGRLARSFNRMTAELAHADQQRRNLTADVAHELRTPLHIIQGNLEGMLDGVYSATPEHINATLEETRLLSRLVEDLQTLEPGGGGRAAPAPRSAFRRRPGGGCDHQLHRRGCRCGGRVAGGGHGKRKRAGIVRRRGPPRPGALQPGGQRAAPYAQPGDASPWGRSRSQAACASACRTTGRASPRKTCPTSSTASGAATGRGRGRRAPAAGWAWRLPASSSRRTAERSALTAARGRGLCLRLIF